MSDPTYTPAGVRERPASITNQSSVEQATATARYLGAKIARLLGVPEIPVEELRINWVTELKEGAASGTYSPKPGIGELRTGDPSISLSRSGGWRDPTVTLAHEVAHAYLLTNSGPDEARWIHEGMADYVAARIGWAGHKTDTEPGDPTQGYSDASRFMAWLEERMPRASEGWLKLVARGVGTPEDNFKAVTKVPLDYMLAVYAEEPYIDDPEPSPFARMLRVRRNLDYLGQRAFDYFLSRSDNYLKRTQRVIELNARLDKAGLDEWTAEANYGGPIVYSKEKPPPNKGDNNTPSEVRPPMDEGSKARREPTSKQLR